AERAPEPADHGVSPSALGGGHAGLDALHQGVAGVDGDARGGVGEVLLFGFRRGVGGDLAEGAVRDVFAVVHPREADGGDALVGFGHGVLEAGGHGCHGDDAPAGGLDLLVFA
ncbi:hypothetical protein KEM55_007446, partial [Ascosphaera atra]